MSKKTTRWFAGIAAGLVAGVGVLIAAQTVEAQYTSRSNSAEAEDKTKAVIGEPAPDFTLEDLDGEEITLSDFAEDGKIVVLEWWNPGCPYVVKHHERMTTMKDLKEKYADEVKWITINSTEEDHRDYGVDEEFVTKWNLGDSTVCRDADGKVGKMYGATRTPHMYIIDTDGNLRYMGAIDNDPRNAGAYKDESKVTNYVDQALKEIIDGETVSRPETRAYGCSIKYAD